MGNGQPGKRNRGTNDTLGPTTRLISGDIQCRRRRGAEGRGTVKGSPKGTDTKSNQGQMGKYLLYRGGAPKKKEPEKGSEK